MSIFGFIMRKHRQKKENSDLGNVSGPEVERTYKSLTGDGLYHVTAFKSGVEKREYIGNPEIVYSEKKVY